MQMRCRECQNLIESQLICEPHRGLALLLNQPKVQIYRCDQCASCFIFTEREISLVLLNDERPALLESG